MLARLCIIASCLGSVFVGSGALAQDGTLLKYKFAKEAPLIFRTTTEMSQTMQIAGQTIENKVTQTEVNALSLIEETKEGHLKLQHRNHELTIKSDLGPAGTYNFDSKATEREKGTLLSNQLNPVYEALSGVEYSITITPEGKVEKIEGYKEILENILKDNPLAAQITGGGSEQAQKDSLAEVFLIFQDKAVKEGDTWEVPFKLELPKIGKAEGKRVYTFEGPVVAEDPKIVRVSVNTELSFDFDLDVDGAKITGNIATDSSKGDVKFDVEQGQVISSTLEYTLSGTINTAVGERTLKVDLKQVQKRSTQRLASLPN
jgi:hypothetical protein